MYLHTNMPSHRLKRKQEFNVKLNRASMLKEDASFKSPHERIKEGRNGTGGINIGRSAALLTELGLKCSAAGQKYHLRMPVHIQ